MTWAMACAKQAGEDRRTERMRHRVRRLESGAVLVRWAAECLRRGRAPNQAAVGGGTRKVAGRTGGETGDGSVATEPLGPDAVLLGDSRMKSCMEDRDAHTDYAARIRSVGVHIQRERVTIVCAIVLDVACTAFWAFNFHEQLV